MKWSGNGPRGLGNVQERVRNCQDMVKKCSKMIGKWYVIVRIWYELAMKVSGKCGHQLEYDLRYSGNGRKLPGNGQGMVRNGLNWSEMA